jgi:hypothetical protein
MTIASNHCISCRFDSLADGTYELIPEPEQGISEDQVNVVEELTEAPNQSLEVIDIPETHPRRQTPDINHYFYYTAIYIFMYIYLCI